MLDRLLKMLNEGDAPSALQPAEEREALAAILVAAARADGDYAEAERRRIDRILGARFGLSPWTAAELRQEGERAEATSAGLHRFTLAVKKAVPFEERIGVIEAVWEVAYADGERAAEEAGLMRQLARLLHVPDRDVGLARQRVAERLGLT